MNKDSTHPDYDWCVTFWYDGPRRAWARVPGDEHPKDQREFIELRTDLFWTDVNGDAHVRLDRKELQHALDMLDGKPVTDEMENAPRVYLGTTRKS